MLSLFYELCGLKPCVWIFAGTEHPGEDKKQKDAQKTSDFLSRINGPDIKLHSTQTSASKEQQTEQVYMGVSLLKQKFKDISLVTEGILHLFHGVKPASGVRSLENIVERFKHIKYSRVDDDNIPDFSEIASQITNDVDDFSRIKTSCEKLKDPIKIEFSQEIV